MMKLTIAALLLASSTTALPQTTATPPSCDAPEYRLLDFWIGSWDVQLASDAGKTIGTNVIEKTLKGCAILEHWSDVLGGEGKSLFYYHRADGTWKQVWVTDAGRIKEKRAVEVPAPGAVRFQGELRFEDGRRVLDRTTLTPLPGGRVRQHIEQSADDGKTWSTTFDAIYTKRAGRGPDPVGGSGPQIGA